MNTGMSVVMDQDPLDKTPAMGAAQLVRPQELLCAAEDDVGDRTLLLDEELSATALWLQVDGEQTRIVLDSLPFSIGRGTDCDLVLADKSVSRQHARISQVSGVLVIEDQASGNGLTINGHRVGRALLADGDRILLGNVALHFGIAPKLAAPVTLPVRRRWRRVTVLAAVGGLVAMIGAVTIEFDGNGMLAALGMPVPGRISDKVQPAATDTSTVSAAAAPVVPDPATLAGPNVSGPPAPGSEPTPVDGRPSAEAVAQAPAQREPDGMRAQRAKAPTVEMRGDEPAGTTVGGAPVDAGAARQASPGAQSRVRAKAPGGTEAEPPAAAGNADEIVEAAKTAYLESEGSGALVLLQRAQASARTILEREQFGQLEHRIAELLDGYEQAASAYAQGRKDEAFALWAEFLEAERALFAARSSRYARDVSSRVAGEYLRLGNQAHGEQRFHDAYRMWERAARIEPSGEASAALVGLQARARALFREGYRLETADLSQARRRWWQVLELVPPGNEYHLKARAKLAWYGRHSR